MSQRSIENEEDIEEERDDSVIATATRYSLVALALIVATVGAWFGYRWLSRPVVVVQTPTEVSLPALRDVEEVTLPKIPFRDVTTAGGIAFKHTNGATGEKLLPETMGGGCAFFDYNSDGAPDILLVNSKPWKHDQGESAPAQTSAITLYKNDGKGMFSDVSKEAGFDQAFYGQGCAIGDFDNDGDQDLFVSAVAERDAMTDGKPSAAPENGVTGPSRLYRNDEGRFVDVTQQAGVSGHPHDWSSSCGWFDYDNDGDLDLWVCNYVDWSRQFDLAQNFRLTGGERAYGRPQAFSGSYPHLYRNEGDGTFTDVAKQAGIQIDSATTGTPLAKSLGLAFHDFDRDGHLDVMVANDTVQNNLFRNLGDGRFQEMAALAGVAFDANGNARGAMGIDISCARANDLCACVAIGNFANEMTAFYVSSPASLVFADQAVANGLGPSTRLFLTFGVFFFDADLDGWDDIFHANGHLEQDISKVQASQTYEQSPQLFWNAGPEAMTEFVMLSDELTGKEFSKPLVGRGAAFADIDADGDLDVLIATAGAKPRLLRNDQQLGHQWLRLKLVGNGIKANRDAIGSRVELELSNGRKLTKIVSPTRSYLSQVELPLTFGLGDAKVQAIKITWPDGTTQTETQSQANTLLTIVQPKP